MNDEIAGQAILNATIRQLVFILMDTASLHILNRDTLQLAMNDGLQFRPDFFIQLQQLGVIIETVQIHLDTGRYDPRSQHSRDHFRVRDTLKGRTFLDCVRQ